MKKYLLVVLVAVAACRKPDYKPLDVGWQPDYNIDRFESSVLAYEKADQERLPAVGGILLTGSSTFTKWENAAVDLEPLPIINRGFGGSTLPELIHYADRMIFKYHPKRIVIYCENDMFGVKEKTPEQTRDAYVQLTKLIHEREPKAFIYCVSLKPSPSRWNKRVYTENANALIQQFIKTDHRHSYIDVWPVMMKNGRPDPAIFLSDSLHMNDEGYRRWTQVLKPILGKTL